MPMIRQASFDFLNTLTEKRGGRDLEVKRCEGRNSEDRELKSSW